MNSLEKMYLERAFFYKGLYKKTKWWKFKQRRYLKEQWNDENNLMIRHS